MSQHRLNLFIQPEHAKRLDELAAKKGVSKSSIVAAALASWLSPDAAEGLAASADDGGPRRQPELSETVAYDPELAASAADLGLLDDDDDLPLPLPRQLDPAMQRMARLASLDPNDGIEL